MNIVVTGGAGFIGHQLVAALCQRGHTITVLDNLHRGSFERPELAAARVAEGDIRDAAVCAAAFEGAACVIHLAAQSNVMGSQDDPDYTFETNVAGTWTVAAAAARAGVAHLIFASSREVYGEPASLPVAEDAPLRPFNLYGASKAAGEALLGTLPWPALHVSVLRLANVIGPGDHGRVVPLWLAAATAGEPLVVYGGGQILDFVPIETVVEAFVRVAEIGPLTEPVNVGSGVPVPLTELAERIIGITRSESKVDTRPARGPEITRFCADTSRMQSILGMSPPTDAVGTIERWWGRT